MHWFAVWCRPSAARRDARADAPCRGFEHCIANMFLVPLSMCLGSGISVGEPWQAGDACKGRHAAL